MSLSARLSASVAFTLTSAPDQGSAKADIAHAIAKTIANGTGNTQADIGWSDERTLASNTSEDLDLAPVTDALGTPRTPVEITTLLIEADPTNTTNLTIGGATAEFLGPFAATGDKILLKPGAFAFFHDPAGWTCGAGSTDDLLVANASGAAAKYKITVLGRSA